MYVDLPTFKRCCCCIPLRMGLVAWGYLRILLTIFLVYLINFKVTYGFQYSKLLWVCVALDVTFNVIFLVGAHLKNPEVIKIYYHYSLVVLVLYAVYAVFNFASAIYIVSFLEYQGDTYLATIVIGGRMALGILDIVLQAYITLLVRSEIFKLKNSPQFKFVTVTGEATYSLDVEDKETQENVKYDRL